MKKIIIPFLLVLTLVFQSCDETQSPIYDGSEPLQTLAYFAESSAQIAIEVTNPSGVYNGRVNVSSMSASDRTVVVSIVTASTTATSNQYSFSTSVTIPANSWGGDLVITGLQDGLDTFGVDLVLQIDSITDDNSVISGSTLTVEIIQTCPFTIANYVGTFAVSEGFTSGVNAPNGLSFFFSEVYQVELALDPSDTTGQSLILTNSAGFNEYIPDGTVITLDEADTKEVIFGAGDPLLAGFRNYAYTGSSYDTCKLDIQCTGPLATFGPYQFTLTKI